jgi:predicted amidohydrolase
MKISLLQYNPLWENKSANKEKILQIIKSISDDSNLLILPEMTLTGFSMATADLAEPLDGESFDFFSELAVSLKIDLISGLIERNADGYYNTLIHINKLGELKSVYRKIHPFSFSEENKHFTSGEYPVITEINGFSVGLSICYDLRFAELFRYYGSNKVDLIINIANWPIPRIEHWNTLLKSRAIENLCYMAGVNRTGSDPKGKYNGFSSVYNPLGESLVFLEESEGIIETEIFTENVNEVRTKFPFLSDMKPKEFWSKF